MQDWSIAYPFFLAPKFLIDCVPPSQLYVFYRFVLNIYKNLRTKKLRFQNHMDSTVKSNIRPEEFKDNCPIHELRPESTGKQYQNKA